MKLESQPRVSVVTPFYNTAEYLAECIESVLAQTYTNFEYLLVNNKSTDGSREIAESYQKRDSRIRLIDNEEFVGMVENYNGAFGHIAADSKYVKMIQADDAAFPECLERLVAVAESEPTAGIVSSFWLWGNDLRGEAFDRNVRLIPGREACRKTLLERRQYTGSQTTVLYRADIVRKRKPFYALTHPFSDSDTAFEIMLEHDLGFVHQVLTFNRKDNDSVLKRVMGFHPLMLHFYLTMERYGALVLTPAELAKARSEMRNEYYAYLASQLIRLQGSRFWAYHRAGLATLDQDVPWSAVALRAAAELAKLVLNPESTLERTLPWFSRRVRQVLKRPATEG